MSALKWVLLGLLVWAALVVVIGVFVHGCATGRRRVEGGRPEDRL